MTIETLVTGGAGFVGSHLVDRLVKDKLAENITIIDDLTTGSKDNVRHLISNQVKFLEATSDTPHLKQSHLAFGLSASPKACRDLRRHFRDCSQWHSKYG